MASFLFFQPCTRPCWKKWEKSFRSRLNSHLGGRGSPWDPGSELKIKIDDKFEIKSPLSFHRLLTVPESPACKLFCIFIASTTANSCPSWTWRKITDIENDLCFKFIWRQLIYGQLLVAQIQDACTVKLKSYLKLRACERRCDLHYLSSVPQMLHSHLKKVPVFRMNLFLSRASERACASDICVQAKKSHAEVSRACL